MMRQARLSSAGPPQAALPASVWRAAQMGSHQGRIVPSGHRALDRELPDGGWPSAAMIELLPQQSGIGELRLLRPALQKLAATGPIALLQPPHLPQVAAWTGAGIAADKLLWIRPSSSADAFWSAEQILRNGSCGALLFWHAQARPEALRRLHLAAQAGDVAFWMLRPLAEAVQPSPAPLRLALHPAAAGLAIGIVKRRGPHRDAPLLLEFDDSTLPSVFPDSSPVSAHAHLDRHPPATAPARSHPAVLA